MSGKADPFEQQIKATLEAWTDEGACPPDRFDALIASARRQRRAPLLLRWAGAAAAVLLLLLVVPQVRVWAAEALQRLPVVGEFIGRVVSHAPDLGWAWAVEHGQFQTILAESNDQGYTFRVHEILADAAETTMIFTITGPEPFDARYVELTMLPLFDGQFFSPSRGEFGEVIDGVFVGATIMHPLPAESGTLRLQIPWIDGVTGNWDLTFPVSRARLSAISHTIEVNQEIQLDLVTLLVERVVMSPVQTMVELSYSGPSPSPDLFGSGFMPSLSAGGVPLKPRGMNGLGDGQVMAYRLSFEAVPETAEAITLGFNGLVIFQETVTSLPLREGATGGLQGGWPLTVEEVVQQGREVRILLSFPHTERDNWPYEGWRLLDDQGVRHGLNASRQPQLSSGRSAYRFTVQLPEGRTPALLEAQGGWQKVTGPWELTVPLR